MIHWRGIYLLNYDNLTWKKLKPPRSESPKQYFFAPTGLQQQRGRHSRKEERSTEKEKPSQRMDMASCNNCNLKEKEQVYTSARDGNLMHLKVSTTRRLPARASYTKEIELRYERKAIHRQASFLPSRNARKTLSGSALASRFSIFCFLTKFPSNLEFVFPPPSPSLLFILIRFSDLFCVLGAVCDWIFVSQNGFLLIFDSTTSVYVSDTAIFTVDALPKRHSGHLGRKASGAKWDEQFYYQHTRLSVERFLPRKFLSMWKKLTKAFRLVRHIVNTSSSTRQRRRRRGDLSKLIMTGRDFLYWIIGRPLTTVSCMKAQKSIAFSCRRSFA